MIRKIFSSSPGNASLDDTLQIAFKQLEDAQKSKDKRSKALSLCKNAKSKIKEAEKIFTTSQVGDPTRHDGIATAYHKHGQILDTLGLSEKALKSHGKAKIWGYGHVNIPTSTYDTVPLLVKPAPLLTSSDPLLVNPALLPVNPASLPVNPALLPVNPALLPVSLAPLPYVPLPTAVPDAPRVSYATTSYPFNIYDDAPQILQTHQSFTPNVISTTATTTTSKPETIKPPVQNPRAIFDTNIISPITKYDILETDARLTSTPQLAYTLSLLNDKINDPNEQKRLRTLATDVIREFVRDDLKKPDAVAEVVSLAAVLGRDDFRELLLVVINGIRESILLEFQLLEGLAQLLRNAAPGYIEIDDLIKILNLLTNRLMGTHQQSTQTHRLAMTISLVLDSMVDCHVRRLNHWQLHGTLSDYLKELQESSDPSLVYQAVYAYQALQYIPDDETILQSMVQRTGEVAQDISGVVSSVKTLDLNLFIEGLQNIQAGLEATIKPVSESSTGSNDQEEGGLELLGSLKKEVDLNGKSAWYPALRGLDVLLHHGRLADFKKLIYEAPCRHDPAFQLGVYQRLGGLAANTQWDSNARQGFVMFLGELYKDDMNEDQKVGTKQWILYILNDLTASSDNVIANQARDTLQGLSMNENSEDSALVQNSSSHSSSPYFLTTTPPLSSFPLLDLAQNKPDVELALRRIKRERLKKRDGDIYISPRAKVHIKSKADFDLTSKVQEFLESDQKVLLLLGDSGVGKTTFSRALETSLWENYKANGRIPLHIYLPTIELPEYSLIEKQLEKIGFMEEEIKEMKKHREFILICDGYDESQQARNLYTSNQLNRQGQWRAQLVITCRTGCPGINYQECFQPTDLNNNISWELYEEVILAPFNKGQVQDYTLQYVSSYKSSWESIDYQQAFKEIQNLRDMVTNPFLLKMALNVLPTLVDKESNFSAARITRTLLYDQFVAQWIERSKIRFGGMELSDYDKASYKMLMACGFNQKGIIYLKELATAIYDQQGGKPFISYSEPHDLNTWKEEYFSRKDGKNLLQEAIPLFYAGDQYRFIHKSVLEYGLSLAIFDPNTKEGYTEQRPKQSQQPLSNSTVFVESLEITSPSNEKSHSMKHPLLDSPLGTRNLVNEPSILLFLVERVQQYSVFRDQLYSIVLQSKTEKSLQVAAANAITVLVKAGKSFNRQDLRGIQVPGADLSYGMFDSAQLDGADLRNTNLHNIWLRRALLCGAQMTGVQFGEAQPIRNEDEVYCGAYSRDGKLYAAGIFTGLVNVYNTSTWKIVQSMRVAGRYSTNTVVFSKKGDRLISGHADHDLQIWDVKTGARLDSLWGHKEPVTSVIYSPDEEFIASASEDRTVRLWNVSNGYCFRVFEGHTNRISSISYAPNGARIASGSWDNTIRLWDAESGNCVSIFRGHTDSVHSVMYSPSGDQLVSGSSDRTIRLWEAETGTCTRVLEGHSGKVYSVVYSPSGNQIASGSVDQTVRVWEAETADCLHIFHGHTSTVQSVLFSPDSNRIVSASLDHTIRLWNIEPNKSVHNSPGHGREVDRMIFSPDEKYIASASKDLTIRIWDMETGDNIITLYGHDQDIHDIAFSPKGDRIASGSKDFRVRVWSTITGKCIHNLEGHHNDVKSVAFSTDGKQVASGSMDNRIRLWDVKTGKCDGVLEGHTKAVTIVQYSPDGELLASGSNDHTIRIWHANSGISVHTLKEHFGIVSTLTFWINGGLIVSGGYDRLLVVWNAMTGKRMNSHVQPGTINSVAISPDGNSVAIGSSDETVRILSTYTKRNVRRLEGHTGNVLSVAYSPNGEILASASEDKTVRLWEVESGKCIVIISGFSGSVKSVAWGKTPDTYYLVTSCADLSLRRWIIFKAYGQYQAELCWSTSHDRFTVEDALFKDVEGLSQYDSDFLKDSGAVVHTTPKVKK
ncbi:hypothetical protein BGZ49_007606 [Haplosporangium sp. Z 27]|nr:hypothetical protein BGZ49_007606 [Haplosporangium sp. Z 27]